MFKLFSLLGALALLLVAVLDLPSAAAQNDEQTGRIVARLLDDGRVEFGWQPTGAARVLPRQRYFPADATVDRWLRSSPVEVGGAEIGRINARLLEDGRIEFAFTPTDGERIEPPARYFPADARAGRWLRSTEIAIGPARTGYIAVSSGWEHSCGLRSDGEIKCWGRSWGNEAGQPDAPAGPFTTVSAGSNHNCGLRTSGEIECWGHHLEFVRGPQSPGDGNHYKAIQPDAPPGRFTAVSAGLGHTCALRESGAIECWGNNHTGQTNAPPGSFTAVSAGDGYTCGLRKSGAINCWGTEQEIPPPVGSYTAVSVGRGSACAIRTSGEIACWGWADTTSYNHDGTYTKSSSLTRNVPTGRFSTISAGSGSACAIRTSGEIACWGGNTARQNDVPDGRFTTVSTSYSHYANIDHTCAIRESSGTIECWGSNNWGQATPPTN